MTDNNDKQIDDIIAMIDSFMTENGGHMNISVNNNGETKLNKNTKTTNSLECAAGDLACQIPTLHEGLDGNENE